MPAGHTAIPHPATLDRERVGEVQSHEGEKQFYHSGLNGCGSVIRTRASIDEDSLTYYRPLKTRSPTPLHYPLPLCTAPSE